MCLFCLVSNVTSFFSHIAVVLLQLLLLLLLLLLPIAHSEPTTELLLGAMKFSPVNKRYNQNPRNF